VPELEHLGHECAAPDLPFHDAAGASDWADTVIESIPSDAEEVVVVGHSLGGLCVPVVADRREVRRMVFLGAMVPVPGRSYTEVMAEEPGAITIDGSDQVLSEEGLTLRRDAGDEGEGDGPLAWSFARRFFYDDLPEDVARRAWGRLRPQGFAMFTEPCPIGEWPSVPSTYILMTGDRAVSPEWSRSVAAGRLGCDVVELPGGHSPFYARPAELARVLDQLAGTSP
jgi:pimeloyl-ACP methyl ester carboxylesterase